MSEWRLGDKAIRTFDGTRGVSVVVECRQHAADGPHWHHADGGWDLLSYSSAPIQSMATYRPLVLIDPEDREAVERLLTGYRSQDGWYKGNYRESVKHMQAALREFAVPKPVRPDEPQGLGAVVEDAEGRFWTLATKASATPWGEVGDLRWRAWADIDAVRVVTS